MQERAAFRVRDVIDAISQIELLADDLTYEVFLTDRIKRAAFERFVEIISEASRHLPDELKRSQQGINWQAMADIGNHLRHVYHRADAEILWNLHEHGHLAKLKAACVAYLRGNSF
jgi:uncharacterized protein with HEPN domain